MTAPLPKFCLGYPCLPSSATRPLPVCVCMAAMPLGRNTLMSGITGPSVRTARPSLFGTWRVQQQLLKECIPVVAANSLKSTLGPATASKRRRAEEPRARLVYMPANPGGTTAGTQGLRGLQAQLSTAAQLKKYSELRTSLRSRASSPSPKGGTGGKLRSLYRALKSSARFCSRGWECSSTKASRSSRPSSSASQACVQKESWMPVNARPGQAWHSQHCRW